jgi:uncharacterized protein YigE (DUF2233 family)
MKFFNSAKYALGILPAIYLVMCSSKTDDSISSPAGTCSAAIQGDNDSLSKAALQKLIDSAYPAVAGYSRLLFIRSRLTSRLDSTAVLLYKMGHNTDSAENTMLLKFCQLSATNGIQPPMRKELRDFYIRIADTEKEQLALRKDSAATADSLAKVKADILRIEPSVSKVLQRIHGITSTLSGPLTLNFNNTPYRLFFVSDAGYALRIHCKKSGDYTFSAYKNYLAKNKKDTVLMMTNGGMFKTDYQPQGLLVSEGKEYAAIDTSKAIKNGNFYLYPNGVFYTDTPGWFHITETQLYRNMYAAKNKTPLYATQSGPMLASNGKIHAQFMYGSVNINIRSGVGIPGNDGKAVFVISEKPVNFYDFSMVFLHFLNCSDALYLDGAISKMYFSTDKTVPDGSFGPMISILKN